MPVVTAYTEIFEKNLITLSHFKVDSDIDT